MPSPADLPYPEIEPGSPALQTDSLPTELSGKPSYSQSCIKKNMYEKQQQEWGGHRMDP